MSNRYQKSQETQPVSVKNSDRWQVYYRLLDLNVPCSCSLGNPLLVELHSPLVAIQVWQVLRQTEMKRVDLINWLETCWQTDLSQIVVEENKR